MSSPQLPLGALLVQMGFVTDDELAEALQTQERSGLRLGKVLIQGAVITEDRLVHALSQQLGIEACDPIMTPVHDAVLSMVPPAVAFKHRILPVARQRSDGSEVLYVATADPLDKEAAEAIARGLAPGTTMRWMLAGETEMDLALARHYGSAPSTAPSSAPQVRVIQGSPIAPPRRPDEQLHSSLNSTGDIFTALQEAVEFTGPPAVSPPRIDSSYDLQVVLPNAQSGLPSADGSADDETNGDIIIADEVVESDVHSPEALDGHAPVEAETEVAPDEPPEPTIPEPAVPAGPSWGDLLGAEASQEDDDGESADLTVEAALTALKESATILPTARESLVVAAAPIPEPEAPVQSPPLIADLAESPSSLAESPSSLAELGLEDMPHTPFPEALEVASPDDTLPADPPPDASVFAGADDTSEAPPVAETMDVETMDADAALFHDDVIVERPQEVDAQDMASGLADFAHSGDVARQLVRQFVAGSHLSDVETKWVMRVLAGAMLQSGLLEDEAISELLIRLGPPPGSP